jgi:hypothetical protein
MQRLAADGLRLISSEELDRSSPHPSSPIFSGGLGPMALLSSRLKSLFKVHWRQDKVSLSGVGHVVWQLVVGLGRVCRLTSQRYCR